MNSIISNLYLSTDIFKLAEASSAISSSERIQPVISEFKFDKGSMLSNNWSRLLGSPSASSLRANVFTRKAIFNKELIFKSSPAPSALPISSLLRLALISCNPEMIRFPLPHE